MALIDNHDVPACFLDIVLKLGIVFQGVYGYDGLIVIVEGILVDREFRFDSGNPVRIQAHQWNGKSIPYLLLELGEDGLQCQDQYSLAFAPFDHFSKEDTHFNRFAESHTIGNQQSGPGKLKRF